MKDVAPAGRTCFTTSSISWPTKPAGSLRGWLERIYISDSLGPKPLARQAHIDVTVFLHLGETTNSLISTLSASSVFWTSYGDLCQRTGPRRPELQDLRVSGRSGANRLQPLTCRNRSATRCDWQKRPSVLVGLFTVG